MSTQETCKITTRDETITACVYSPDEMDGKHARPAILITCGVIVPKGDAAGFLDEILEALTDSGLIVVTYEPHCTSLILDDYDAYSIKHEVAEVGAILSWMAERPDIDRESIGVIGYSIGAIAACGASSRRDDIARLCLIGPASAQYVSSSTSNGNGKTPVISASHFPAAYLPSLSTVDSISDTLTHDRPTLILHGAADQFVPPNVSMQFIETFESAGRSIERLLIARADHMFSLPPTRKACLDHIRRFFAAMRASEKLVMSDATQ